MTESHDSHRAPRSALSSTPDRIQPGSLPPLRLPGPGPIAIQGSHERPSDDGERDRAQHDDDAVSAKQSRGAGWESKVHCRFRSSMMSSWRALRGESESACEHRKVNYGKRHNY